MPTLYSETILSSIFGTLTESHEQQHCKERCYLCCLRKKRVLCLTAKSPVASRKEKRWASNLLWSTTLSTLQPQVRQELMAVDGWTTANSGWELWMGAAGHGVTRKICNSCSQEHNTKVICTHTSSERSSHLLNSHLRDGEFSLWLCQEQSETDPDTRSKAMAISSSPDSIIKRQDTTLTSSLTSLS